jgi:hypothetical protein
VPKRGTHCRADGEGKALSVIFLQKNGRNPEGLGLASAVGLRLHLLRLWFFGAIERLKQKALTPLKSTPNRDESNTAV